jgi:hypothetical protein
MNCHENIAENAATSVMNLIRSLGPRYRQMANADSDAFHCQIYRTRRQRAQLPTMLTEEEIDRIFLLRHERGLRIEDIAKETTRTATTVSRILNRKHKLSANYPKHKNEP